MDIICRLLAEDTGNPDKLLLIGNYSERHGLRFSARSPGIRNTNDAQNI